MELTTKINDLGMESVFYGFEIQKNNNMNAREKLDEFAEMRGMNKNELIGWSIAADFAEWYAEQVKKCYISDVINQACGDCIYYLTCNSESRDKQICDNYDNEP